MAQPGPGQGPRQPFGAIHHGCVVHAVSSVLTIHIRFSRRTCVRDQATTRLGEVLTRAQLVPQGMCNNARFGGKVSWAVLDRRKGDALLALTKEKKGAETLI